MKTDLVLHCGAVPVTRDELSAYKAPAPVGRWFPISHSRVLNTVETKLSEAGYHVERESFGVMKDGSRFFATLDLSSELADGVALAVGIRNSIDKSLPLGFCAGSRVFVCDNLAFGSEMLVRRKHTRNGERDFVNRISDAVGSLKGYQSQESARIARMKEMTLTPDRADAMILRSYESGIISSRELPDVLSEWRNPGYDDFRAQTTWSLFNAFTSALRERANSQPQRFASVTMRLYGLLDPSSN